MSNGNGREIDYKKAFEESQLRLHSMQNAVSALQNKLVDKQEEINLLMKINASGERQMFAQKNINHDVMTQNNAATQELAQEIERLRGLVKELGGNPNL